MKSLRWAGAVLALFACIPASASTELVLGRVDGDPITLEQLKKEFEARHMGHIGMLAEEATVREFLAAAVRRRLFVHEGYRMGLDEDPSLAAAVEKRRDASLADWLFKSEIEDKVRVDDKTIAAAIEAQKKSREVVLVQTDTEADAVAARRAIEDGEDPQDVARRLSTAPSRLRGGIVPVRWGDTEPALESAILAAEDGALVGPIAVDEGWAVAKVVSKTAVTPFDEAKARTRAENVTRVRAIATRRARFLDSLRAKHQVAIDESLLEPDILAAAVRREESAPHDERVLARWDSGTLTVAELADGIRDEAFLALSPGRQRREAGFLLANRIDAELARIEARRREAEAPASVKALILTYADDLVFRALVDKVVLKDVTVSDGEISAWYAEHRSEFLTPEEIQLGIALLATEEDARSFLADVAAGNDFGELAAQRSRDKTTAAKKGVAGWVSEDRAAQALRGEPFRRPVGSVGGPVAIDAGWLAYKVLDRREPRQKQEAEVRAEIRRKLLDKKADETLDTWEAALKKKATIDLDEAAVKKATAVLAQEQEKKTAATPPPLPTAGPHGKSPPHGGAR